MEAADCLQGGTELRTDDMVFPWPPEEAIRAESEISAQLQPRQEDNGASLCIIGSHSVPVSIIPATAGFAWPCRNGARPACPLSC